MIKEKFIKCKGCGIQFERAYYKRAQRYCTPKCHQLAIGTLPKRTMSSINCGFCDKIFLGFSNKLFCCQNCRNKACQKRHREKVKNAKA